MNYIDRTMPYRIQQQITEADGVATIVSPGPSSIIVDRCVYRGFVLSVNNAIPFAPQFFKDIVEPRSDEVIYAHRKKHDEIKKLMDANKYSWNQVTFKKTGNRLHKNGALQPKLVTPAAAMAYIIMLGAKRIYIIGNDFCDPNGKSTRRGHYKTSMWDLPKNERYWRNLRRKKRRYEQTCLAAAELHGATIVNLSPFCDIENTERSHACINC